MFEVTKYHNSLNDVSFKEFNAVEFDLFFMLCYKMKERKTETVRITFDEIKRLINYKSTSSERFIDDLDQMYKKMLNLSFKFEDEKVLSRFNLFSSYDIYKKENYISVAVHPKFEFILNVLDSNFTRFELAEFINLKSKYSKTMYRLLKQWRSVGKKKFSIAEFRHVLGIPDSYTMSKINSKVLKPINNELTPYFENLEINKLKNGRGRGGTVTDIEFTFKKQLPPKKELPKVSLKNWLSEGKNS